MTRVACDVVVVGGGPAGMAAASRAAECGARTLLVDEGLSPGGQIWRATHAGERVRAARRLVDRLAVSGAAIRSSTSVVDVERAGGRFRVTAESRGEMFGVDASSIVLATGARELFLPFPGWTLPNAFGVGAAQALMKSGMPVRGKRVVVAGTGPLVLAVAASLAAHGAEVRFVAEQAPFERVTRFAARLWRNPGRAVQAMALRARIATVRYAIGTWVSRAHGSSRVESVTVTDGGSTRTIDCDLLCTAFGLVPNVELPRFLGCAVEHSGVQVNEQQMTTVDGVFCAGEPTGIGGVELSLVEGEIAGAVAAGRAPGRRLGRARARLRDDAAALAVAFELREELLTLASADTILCRCEDVPLGDVDRTWTPRQAKLYTRVGMGPCQGRVCGAALECLWGWPREIPRQPVQPTSAAILLGASAGAPSI
jgi:D-hydroxyproline dehydrogenase subunit alpha